jgi:hypothetical protein
MKSEDLLMDSWLQWQMDNLSLLSSWMHFDHKFLQAAETEVQELCLKLKAE